MDDPRIQWVGDRVNHALLIDSNDVFDELLNREDGEAERSIGKFLNETPENDESAIIFYKVILQEEEEYEVECGMLFIMYIQCVLCILNALMEVWFVANKVLLCCSENLFILCH